MKALLRFFALSARRRALLIASLLLLPFIDISLRLAGYNKTRLILDRAYLHRRQDPGANRAQVLQDVAWAVSAASRRVPFAASCLRRSILIAQFLRQHRITAKIQFAVRRSNGRLAAHAWVECDGEIVGDSPAIAREFTILDGKRASSIVDRRSTMPHTLQQ
jgi:hypothetical protein